MRFKDFSKKLSESSEEYEKFFRAALKKFGAESPEDLQGEKRKEFFDFVDQNWDAKNENL